MADQAHDSSVQAAIADLHAAMAKVANGDVSAIKALYAQSEDATSFYGWGGYEKGAAAVAERWDWAGRQFKGGTVSYQNLTTVAGSELFYTTDIETFRVRVDELAAPTQWSNRVTHIFRRDNNTWRLLHRHGNRLEEQYKPGTRLRPLEAMPAVTGLSHLTFIVRDLDRMSRLIETVLGGREVYASGDQTFSVAREKFFVAGGLWIAIMEGEPLPSRTYNHIAFKADERDLPELESRIEALGLELLPSRPRVGGEGASLYFHDWDNHLFELHTGTLEERLERYRRGR